MSDMTTIRTCDKCGETYRESLVFGHACLTRPAKYPTKVLAELLAAGEINREQYERLRRETATGAKET